MGAQVPCIVFNLLYVAGGKMTAAVDVLDLLTILG